MLHYLVRQKNYQIIRNDCIFFQIDADPYGTFLANGKNGGICNTAGIIEQRNFIQIVENNEIVIKEVYFG